MSERIPRVLAIAGSDSGGGAGIQADLKAFAACGVHGMTAVTAVTAQSTVGVSTVHTVPPEVIIAQVVAVQEDIGIDAVKIGMLGDPATVAAVAVALERLPGHVPVVLDPVMVAESGAELLRPAAREQLILELLPRATVATPNVPEAYALLDGRNPALDAQNEPDAAALARSVLALGPRAVVVTGGHREQATDVFFDGETMAQLGGQRYPDGASHGSGCTHSAVLAARLGWGDEPLQAARVAKELAARAVENGLDQIGAGAGPVDVLGIVNIADPHR